MRIGLIDTRKDIAISTARNLLTVLPERGVKFFWTRNLLSILICLNLHLEGKILRKRCSCSLGRR